MDKEISLNGYRELYRQSQVWAALRGVLTFIGFIAIFPIFVLIVTFVSFGLLSLMAKAFSEDVVAYLSPIVFLLIGGFLAYRAWTLHIQSFFRDWARSTQQKRIVVKDKCWKPIKIKLGTRLRMEMMSYRTKGYYLQSEDRWWSVPEEVYEMITCGNEYVLQYTAGSQEIVALYELEQSNYFS